MNLVTEVRKLQGSFLIDVSFSTRAAGVTALFGQSGAGKTSVINMVAGLTRPDAGLITIDNEVFFDSGRGIDVPPHHRRVGYIFQDARLFPHMSVRSNLMYGMKLTPPDLRYVEFDQVVGLLGIGPLLKRTPAKLSGGEKQRVAIGRALLASPRMLLMDEPLSSLDEDRKSELIPFIARLPLQFGIPILYVSHSAREIRELADYIVTIEGGRVMDCGPASETAAKIGLHVPESRLRTVHLRGLEG